MAKRIKTIKHPDALPAPKHLRAVEEINNQTARGAAIAGGAYLDLLLRGALERRLRNGSEIHERIFENRGPLNDFSSRILFAYALQIIGHSANSDLSKIREIRNAFAHSADAFDFGREDVATLCDNLWCPNKIKLGIRPMPSTSREKFTRAIELLADGFYEALKYPISSPPIFLLLGPAPPQPSASPKKQRIRVSPDRPIQNKRTPE
jgi:hypothetical protein